MSLNLARLPFVNSRPVRRLVLVLWCLSALMVAANALFYYRHFAGQEERRERLRALDRQEELEQERLAELERQLAAADLEWQNRQVGFLNLRIAERTFPWSRLFDRLAGVLPSEVRLTRLRPRVVRADGRRRDVAAAAAETVFLELRGEARTDEAMLDLVNKLFEHPAFRDPDLASESKRGANSLIEFTLSVIYMPERDEEAVAAVGGEADAARAPEEGAG